mmetsp:Transcript_65091/g.105527  ORF Transcript_65091/g.105527 Transcript_65091/m.105527 type:complete len:206 (-) Transcript_65091:359-976(-)
MWAPASITVSPGCTNLAKRRTSSSAHSPYSNSEVPIYKSSTGTRIRPCLASVHSQKRPHSHSVSPPPSPSSDVIFVCLCTHFLRDDASGAHTRVASFRRQSCSVLTSCTQRERRFSGALLSFLLGPPQVFVLSSLWMSFPSLAPESSFAGSFFHVSSPTLESPFFLRRPKLLSSCSLRLLRGDEVLLGQDEVGVRSPCKLVERRW